MFAKVITITAFVAVAKAGLLEYSHGQASYSSVSAAVVAHAAPLVKYAAPVYSHGLASANDDKDYYAHPKYEYNYGVQDPHTGDHKSQHEVRDGDVVKGSYTVAEPDGTLRTVHYTADDHNGFNAVVEKAGTPVHPAPAPAPAKIVVAAPTKVVLPAPASYYHH